MSECPSDEVLVAYLHGTLNDIECETIASHVQNCLVCDGMLSDLREHPECLPVRQPFQADSNVSPAIEEQHRSGQAGKPDLPVRQPFQADRIGDERLGPYELLEKLGQGGMGAVYKARHTKLNRIEAIKILPPHLAKDASAKNRFEREMHAVGALNHPNIVQARHADEADGQLYLVMEFVDGCDLASLMKQHGRLPIADACEIIRQAALGLQHAHEHGLVHRDIKPSNLMLSSRSRETSDANARTLTSSATQTSPILKILDLGLARLDSATEQLGELTSTGQIMGTLDYMAPEQGGDAHQVDIRADLYSLGATLYHLLTGQPTFPPPKYKTAAQKLQALTFNEPTPIRELRPEVPEPLAAIVHRLLAKNPDERFAQPHEVTEAIAPFTLGHNLAQLAAAPIAAPEYASTFHHSDPSQAGKPDLQVRQPFQADRALLRPSTPTDHPSQAGKPDVQAAPEVIRVSTLSDRSGQARKPDLRWLAGAAAFLLFGIVIIIRDEKGNEKARLKLDKKETIEIVQDDADAKTATTPDGARRGSPDLAVKPMGVIPESDNATVPVPVQKDGQKPASSELVIGKPIPKPRPVKLDLKPLPVTLKVGDALNSYAIVAFPPPLPGVLSWTIDLREPRGRVTALALSHDQKRVASGGDDGIIRIWNLESRQLEQVLERNSHSYSYGTIKHLDWSPNDEYLVCSSVAAPIEIWNAKNTCFVTTMADRASQPQWSPDGSQLAFALEEGRGVMIYDVAAQRKTRILPHRRAQSVSWSPLGDRIATGGRAEDDTTARIWNAATGELLHTLQHDAIVDSVAWSPDGKFLATLEYSSKGRIRIWNADDARLVSTIGEELNLHESLHWTDDGENLVCGHGWRFHIPTGKVTVRPQGPKGIRGIPLQKGIALVGGGKGEIDELDTQGTPQPAFTVERRHPDNLAFEWSPDGSRITAEYRDQSVEFARIWRTSAEKLMSEVRLPIRAVRWSPNGARIAGVKDGAISIFADPFDHPTTELRVGGANARSIAWFPSGDQIVATYDDFKVRIWRIADHEVTAKFDIATNKSRPNLSHSDGLSISPDSSHLAFHAAGRAWMWNLANGEPVIADVTQPSIDQVRFPVGWKRDPRELFQFREIKRQAPFLAWHPDGQRGLTGDLRVQFQIENRLTGQSKRLEIGRPYNDDTGIHGDFSTDGSTFALCGLGMTRLYSTETMKPLTTLILLRNDQPLAISADGHYRSDEDVTDAMVYVVQTAEGQQTLTPAEFSQKYSWKNDPAKVRLLAP